VSPPRKKTPKARKPSPAGKGAKTPGAAPMSKEDQKFWASLRREISATRFDSEGFRIITPAGLEKWGGAELHPFPDDARPPILENILECEMCRECEWAYRYHSAFISWMLGEIDCAKFKVLWPGAFVPYHLFPLPAPERIDKERIEALKKRPSAIFECPFDEIPRRLVELQKSRDVLPLFRAHFLEIDWSAGIEAVREDLLEWAKKAMPAGLPTLRGRKAQKDHLHALAAYRARRAGYDYSALPGIYSDQPQFLRACRAAEKRLRNYNAWALRAIVKHEEENLPW
jgi:hypothetical protein